MNQSSQCFELNEISGRETKQYAEEEYCLAQQLKQICDEKGRENNPQESAPILHKMGKLYQMRSKEMFSLIKSAALYNAAIVRSSEENKRAIEEDLHHLCELILIQAGATNKDANLIDQAKKVKNEVVRMRSKSEEKLNLIQTIADNQPAESLKEMEREKVEFMNRLQDEITHNYKRIMVGVAEYCENVMGEAPCKFAVAGMGSLARKEVTPYSDFEHIILLEMQQQWKQHLKYFRWFTVIFHIILINIQETIVPSVNVFSLNDEDSKFGNWFYDAFTKRGVSFDGMMAHACKFPLGRIQPTKLKSWTTELILPVDEMLKYLNSTENLKNGYHLGDILTKTCFVYKDETIYKQFENEVYKVLNLSEPQDIKDQVADDLKKCKTSHVLNEIKRNEELNIKQHCYRSTTLFLSALGRIYKIKALSCFDIVIELAEKKIISEFAQHHLMYGIALACEIRLKWYSRKNKQCDIIHLDSSIPSVISALTSMVGKTSIGNYFRIAYALQSEISRLLTLKKKSLYIHPILLDLDICLCFGDEEQLLLFANEKHNFADIKLFNFDDCLQLMLKSQSQGRNEDNRGIAVRQYDVGNILFKYAHYDEAKTRFEISVDNFIRHIEDSGDLNCLVVINEQFTSCFTLLGRCFLETNKYESGKEYFNRMLQILATSQSHGFIKKVIGEISYYLAACLMKLDNHIEAQPHLEKALQIKKELSTDEDTDRDIASVLYLMGQCFALLNDFPRAFTCWKSLRDILLQISNNPNEDHEIKDTICEILYCIIEMKARNDRRRYFWNIINIYRFHKKWHSMDSCKHRTEIRKIDVKQHLNLITKTKYSCNVRTTERQRSCILWVWLMLCLIIFVSALLIE